MEESLLTKIRDYHPRAFRLGNGQLFCRMRQLPPELASEVLTYNERIHPRRAVPVVRSTTPARSTATPPKSPQRLALEALYQACLDRGGPTLDEADELAAKVGVQVALELVRECGSTAPMAALALKVWGKGSAWG